MRHHDDRGRLLLGRQQQWSAGRRDQAGATESGGSTEWLAVRDDQRGIRDQLWRHDRGPIVLLGPKLARRGRGRHHDGPVDADARGHTSPGTGKRRHAEQRRQPHLRGHARRRSLLLGHEWERPAWGRNHE
ncbi:MAG: hypothetical protein DMD62_14165, partial [Gemmatimonadetes bacterium]